MKNRLILQVTLSGVALLLVSNLAYSNPHSPHVAAECRSNLTTRILNVFQTRPIKQLVQSLQEVPPNILNSESCIPRNYRSYEVKEVLRGWEKRGSEDHAEIAGMFDMVILSNTSNRPLESNIFLICDPQGEIYAIGRLSEASASNYLNLSLLISSPDSNRRGGGKAAIKHIMKQCILKKKDGINLVALPGAYGFYTKMGFKQIPGYSDDLVSESEDLDKTAGSFTIDRSAILKFLELGK
ncbi:MAG: GNAT family N-acetyltransferase [Bdellovibrionia bacterium]